MMLTIVESVAGDLSAPEKARPYFESACVSLYSAGISNPRASRRLVTNIDVPEDCRRILDNMDCEVIRQPFNDFDCGSDVPWRLAYYKLCALQTIADETGANAYLLLDTDTWVGNSLTDLESELVRGGVVLYDLHASLSEPDRALMRQEYAELTGGDATHARFFGGELVLGDSAGLGFLLNGCRDVMERMERTGIFSKRGDEFLYFAADALGLLPAVTDANPYIARCWTGRYYSAPRWEDRAILHLPSEKVYAFPKAFRALAKTGGIDGGRFLRWCGLRSSKRRLDPAWICARLLERASVKR